MKDDLSLDDKLSEPKDDKPSEPGDDKLSEPRDDKPSEPGDDKPSEPKDDTRFEFKIDGEQLYAPREAMTVQELIDIAFEQRVLDPVEDGYTLEDEKGNTFAADSVVDLDKTNVFHATENAPGPASGLRMAPNSL